MTKLLPSICIAAIAFTSCKKNPVKIAERSPEVNYSITDSMHLSAITIANFPELSDKYSNKTYSRETNKVRANFKVEGPDIILQFSDTSVANLGTELFLKIPNKTLSTISGHYSAQLQAIYFKWQQTTSSSSSVFLVNYERADTCTIQLDYDSNTKTLSGAITKLKYPFGVYVPYYQTGSAVTAGPGDDVFLTSGGSFRQHTITFQHIKSL